MTKKQHHHSRVIVIARSDGRGGVRPFGIFGKNQKGIDVFIHGKPYKVSSDGRVNIPKRVMDKGTRGPDGRKRIEIEFSTRQGRSGPLTEVYTRTFKPRRKSMGLKTGKPVRIFEERKHLYETQKDQEFTWSPDK